MNNRLRGKIRLATFALLVMGLLMAVAAPVALASPEATTVTRPISDWLDAQGTYCVDDGMGGCILFEPPVANYLAWTDPARNRIGSFDYAGLANEWIVANGGDSLGTTMSGKVIERTLPDGRAAVHVILKTKRALTFVADGLDFGGPLLFGYRPAEVLAGAEPALCNGTYILKFKNTAPGAPLPDFMQLAFAPEPGQEITQINIKCVSKGSLRALYGVPEGTPGMTNITQNAKVIRGALTFTVENVKLFTR
jgi:hypothetical protein